MLECNYLSILLKPTYEKPIDTSEDILERGLTVINAPGRQSLVELKKKSPFNITRALAHRTIVAKVFLFIEILFLKYSISCQDYGEYDDMIKYWIIGNGSAVVDTAYMYKKRLVYGRFYRSKETVATNYQPFASFMLNKKWWLEEEFNNHLLRFQQVPATRRLVHSGSEIQMWMRLLALLCHKDTA